MTDVDPAPDSSSELDSLSAGPVPVFVDPSFSCVGDLCVVSVCQLSVLISRSYARDDSPAPSPAPSAAARTITIKTVAPIHRSGFRRREGPEV